MATRVLNLVRRSDVSKTEPKVETKTEPKVETKTEIKVKGGSGETSSPQFNGQLYPFQTEVFNWARKSGKGIIGLDMGLGKTVITIAILCAGAYQRTMIVLPLALLNQWHESFKKFTDIPHKEICLYQGRYRKALNLKDYRIVLTTYDVIRTDMTDANSPLYRAIGEFDCAVLDEAHKIRNKKTQLYLACRDLFASATSKWLLSGTVIHNNFTDFVNLIDFLDLPDFDPKKIKSQETLAQWKSQYYYRLTKSQCDLRLPDKTITQHMLGFDEAHIDVYVDVFAEVKEMYDQYLRMPTRVNYNNLLSKILRLRQCCNHPDSMLSQEQYQVDVYRHSSPTSAKFTKIAQILHDKPNNDKILIFSQW
jgi:SNF2 family DNA or RNA helicase